VSGDYPSLLKRRATSMLKLAERLLSEGEYDLAVLNAEYAAQLYVKALLNRLSGDEWRGHSVRTLLGALALVVREGGLEGIAETIQEFVRHNRRMLAELDEAHVRSIYGPLQYSREQAEALVQAAKSVVALLKGIEEQVFGSEGDRR